MTLRLFASLREIAGTGRAEIEAVDVPGLMDEAARRFGPSFVAAAETAKVWVDGEPITGDAALVRLVEGCEVALIPPVSGGAT